MQIINEGDWTVSVLVDEDSHLNIFVAHPFNDIVEVQTEQGESNEFNVRLTSLRLEREYEDGL